jgi:hypothetical protein
MSEIAFCRLMPEFPGIFSDLFDRPLFFPDALQVWPRILAILDEGLSRIWPQLKSLTVVADATTVRN